MCRRKDFAYTKYKLSKSDSWVEKYFDCCIGVEKLDMWAFSRGELKPFEGESHLYQSIVA